MLRLPGLSACFSTSRFDAGADDYLIKPFALPEREAQVRAAPRSTAQPTRIEPRRLSYDQADHMVTGDGTT